MQENIIMQFNHEKISFIFYYFLRIDFYTVNSFGSMGSRRFALGLLFINHTWPSNRCFTFFEITPGEIWSCSANECKNTIATDNRVYFPYICHLSSPGEENVPQLKFSVKNYRLGVGVGSLFRYHWKRLQFYFGPGINMSYVNLSDDNIDTEPYCKDGSCVLKIPSIVLPSAATQYAWSQHYGLEFQLSRVLHPYAEFSYYRNFKTTPFSYLLINNYSRIVLGMRVPLSM